MSQNLQNIVKFQKIQLENLVDFEKCCKTHIYLQKSEPIQPKTSNILPKFCRSAVVSPTGGARQGRRTSQGSPAAYARQPSGIYDRGERSGVGDSLQKTFFLHDFLKPNFKEYLFYFSNVCKIIDYIFIVS